MEAKQYTLSVIIQNTDTQDLVMPLFGLLSGLSVPFDGEYDANGVKARSGVGLIAEYSDFAENKLELDEKIRAKFLIIGMEYDHGGSTQLGYDWDIQYSWDGRLVSDTYKPSQERGPSSFYDFLFEVRPEALLKIKVKASHTIRILFKIESQILKPS